MPVPATSLSAAALVSRMGAVVGLRNLLLRLKRRASERPHDYRPSILTFLQLNIDKIAKDLQLVDLGRARGQKEQPLIDSAAFDDIENKTIELIEGEIKSAHALLLDDLNISSHRLHAIDLEGRFSVIDAAALEGISSLRGEVSRGLDRLTYLRLGLKGLEDEMTDFRKTARLNRTAHYPDSAGKVLRWGLIALLFLAEVLGNSYFLAKGSAYGLIGGFAEAVIIAFLNIGGSLLIGDFGLRQCWHRRLWRKLIGLISLAGWLGFAGGFNLLVAHYREAAGVFFEGGGTVALQALKTNPFGLAEFQSWVLFGIGALFAFVALVDALSLDDFYPFYGPLDRALRAARTAYIEERDALIANLGEIKERTVAAMLDAKNDLNKRRAEHGAILDGRARSLHAYQQHLEYLGRAANTLLSIYREANLEARGGRGPVRFGQAWVMEAPPLERGPPAAALPLDKLEAAVAKAQLRLDERLDEVHREYELGFRAYRELEMIAGGQDGIPASAAATEPPPKLT